jgi:hypothetical protein
MPRQVAALVFVIVAMASGALTAQGPVTHHGRAIVEYQTADVEAVAAYEYSQLNHSGPWLLVEFAVRATPHVRIHRDQFRLVSSDERTAVPLATQPQVLEGHAAVSQLLQNATVLRRSLAWYFTTPAYRTIRFFAMPGRTVDPTAVTYRDEVAMGDLLFRSPEGNWKAGTYRLVLDHEQAKADLPITLE